MLTVEVPATEKWDERKNEFVYTKSYVLQMEHSLVSVSKWEAKWNKPFLEKQEKTSEQLVDYIRCMTTTQNVPDDVFASLPSAAIEKILQYINAPMTATTFHSDAGGGRREIITSEIIYCWMINLGIPFECQKWHLNRLLTLIRVCRIKSQPQKTKMGKNELLARNAHLNAARRKQLNTRG